MEPGPTYPAAGAAHRRRSILTTWTKEVHSVPQPKVFETESVVAP